MVHGATYVKKYSIKCASFLEKMRLVHISVCVVENFVTLGTWLNSPESPNTVRVNTVKTVVGISRF